MFAQFAEVFRHFVDAGNAAMLAARAADRDHQAVLAFLDIAGDRVLRKTYDSGHEILRQLSPYIVME